MLIIILEEEVEEEDNIWEGGLGMDQVVLVDVFVFQGFVFLKIKLKFKHNDLQIILLVQQFQSGFPIRLSPDIYFFTAKLVILSILAWMFMRQNGQLSSLSEHSKHNT